MPTLSGSTFGLNTFDPCRNIHIYRRVVRVQLRLRRSFEAQNDENHRTSSHSAVQLVFSPASSHGHPRALDRIVRVLAACLETLVGELRSEKSQSALWWRPSHYLTVWTLDTSLQCCGEGRNCRAHETGDKAVHIGYRQDAPQHGDVRPNIRCLQLGYYAIHYSGYANISM
jgi:hypothetical protein